MPAYVPNATDPSQPTSSQKVESAALEFRTLKTTVVANTAAITANAAAITAALLAATNKTLRVPEATIAALPAVAVRAGKVQAYDAAGNPVMVVLGDVADSSLRTDLASPTGSSLVGHKDNGASAITTTVQTKLQSTKHAVVDFGADPTGATNTTAQLLAFFTACIDAGTAGHIPAGTYLVTAGVLNFDYGHVSKSWPFITTTGYKNTIFNRADATNAPMITISNGTASSGVGLYWEGGSLGGITFAQNGKATGASQHGISLRGIRGTDIGWMSLVSGGGSAVYIPEALYGGTNPDPYAVTSCDFRGTEALFSGGWALENQNWVGLNGCRLHQIRAIQTAKGGWYGFGSGNTVYVASMGSCAGYAFADGTQTSNTGGSPSRNTVHIAELDDMQNGFHLNKHINFQVLQARIVARHNFGPLNPGEGYWPRIGVSLAGGSLPSISDVRMNIIWRIEAGGSLPALGTFINMHNIGSTNIEIENTILDNSGLGITGAALPANVSTSSSSAIFDRGRLVADRREKNIVQVRAAAGQSIGTSYNSLLAKIVYGTELDDRANLYDSSNGWYTVPYTAMYYVEGRITTTPNGAATQMQVGFGVAVAGVYSACAKSKKTSFTAGLGETTFEISGYVLLTKDQQVFFMAAQNGGTSVTSTPVSATADLTWSIRPL